MIFRVLVVEDSAFMRAELTKIIERDPELKVIATAKDGKIALDRIRQFTPDVVTMDINMPVMDGLESLKHIMKQSPLPVVMISTLTEEGAEQTMEALNIGAFDFFHKPSGAISLDISAQGELIRRKIKTAALSKKRIRQIFRPNRRKFFKKPPPADVSGKKPIVTRAKPIDPVAVAAIGVSTGGPKTLTHILPSIPGKFAGTIIIAQHMPAKFTQSFALRLNAICQVPVKEASHREVIKSGTIYIAPGGLHTRVVQHSSQVIRLEMTDHDVDSIHRPSIELLFSSLTETLGSRWLGVMLTGMGDDGAAALVHHHRLGGQTIAEHENSCVVYGMPRKVIELGGASYILPDSEIAEKIVEIAGG